jgi:hypothetical protein
MRIVSAVAPQYERANGPLSILIHESLAEIADRVVMIVRPRVSVEYSSALLGDQRAGARLTPG